MELQYYIQYILSWVYHNVLYTDATFAIVRILIIIGLISLLVYGQYILFVLLCIVVICAEYCKDDGDNPVAQFAAEAMAATTQQPHATRIVDIDELTRGISIGGREGFSLTMPKIIKGDASGKDHRRSNKFIEEDSRDFTEKEFTSKQCSIGSGIGGITMFGSNELIGDTRTATIRGIYDFEGNVTDNSTNDTTTNTKRLKYFKECVFEPVKRSTVGAPIKTFAGTIGATDFRDFKKKVYDDITNNVINIERCLDRFNTKVLFNTSSDITADYSERLTPLRGGTVSGKNNDGTDTSDVSFKYVSFIAGETDNTVKLTNIQALNKGNKGDSNNERTYSALLKDTNDSTHIVYTNSPVLKQRAMDIFGKVYGYRTRIDEILAMMRAQTKDDESLLHTVRISEPVVKELRTMLSYLAIIKQTDAIIKFEEFIKNDTNDTDSGIYKKMLNTTPPPSVLGPIELPKSILDPLNTIHKANNIFKIPLDDDTYNTNDEKRYLYGITYYFNPKDSKGSIILK